MKILLKALPGTGKSTIVKKVIDGYKGEKYGIIALEMRDVNNERVGFESVNLEGERKVFMHVKDIDSDIIIGDKYYVDVKVLDNFVSEELAKGLNKEKALVFIDEIGRAQSHSKKFMDTVKKFFNSNSNFLGTIVYEDEPWSIEFKKHQDVILIEVTFNNREYLPEILLAVFENNNSFNKLNPKQQKWVKDEFIGFLKNNMFIQTKKLFFNTVVYVANNRIAKVNEGGLMIEFHTQGRTKPHKTLFNKATKEYSCDCDLFNGKGDFIGKQGICSHIESAKLLNLEN